MRISDIEHSLEKLRNKQGNRRIYGIKVYDERIEIAYETIKGEIGEWATFEDEYEEE